MKLRLIVSSLLAEKEKNSKQVVKLQKKICDRINI